MIDQRTKITFINDYYRNYPKKRRYCEFLSEGVENAGFGSIQWTSIQTNWFSKGNLPSENIKVNLIYKLTNEFIGMEKLRAKETNGTGTMESVLQDSGKV